MELQFCALWVVVPNTASVYSMVNLQDIINKATSQGRRDLSGLNGIIEVWELLFGDFQWVLFGGGTFLFVAFVLFVVWWEGGCFCLFFIDSVTGNLHMVSVLELQMAAFRTVETTLSCMVKLLGF